MYYTEKKQWVWDWERHCYNATYKKVNCGWLQCPRPALGVVPITFPHHCMTEWIWPDINWKEMSFFANFRKSSSDIQIHKIGVRARQARIIISRGTLKCCKMSDFWAAVETANERIMARVWRNNVMKPAEVDTYTYKEEVTKKTKVYTHLVVHILFNFNR